MLEVFYIFLLIIGLCFAFTLVLLPFYVLYLWITGQLRGKVG